MIIFYSSDGQIGDFFLAFSELLVILVVIVLSLLIVYIIMSTLNNFILANEVLYHVALSRAFHLRNPYYQWEAKSYT